MSELLHKKIERILNESQIKEVFLEEFAKAEPGEGTAFVSDNVAAPLIGYGLRIIAQGCALAPKAESAIDGYTGQVLVDGSKLIVSLKEEEFGGTIDEEGTVKEKRIVDASGQDTELFNKLFYSGLSENELGSILAAIKPDEDGDMFRNQMTRVQQCEELATTVVVK